MKYKFVLFARKRDDGRQPVYLRAYNGEVKYFPLNLYCLASQWDKKLCRFNKSYPEYEAENDLLGTYDQRVRDYLRDKAREKKPPTFRELGQAVKASSQPALSVSVVQAIRARAKELAEERREGTAIQYESMATVIHEYEPGVTFGDIDFDWLEGFEKYLRRKRGNGDARVYSTLGKLRALCNRQKGVPKDWQPFREYKIKAPKSEGGARALSLEDFRKLEAAEPVGRLERLALDLFLLSFYLRGANLADLARLTAKNIVGGRIEYKRHKTGKRYSIEIFDKVQAILDRYAGQSPPYLLPILKKDMDERRILTVIRIRNHTVSLQLRPLAASVGVDASRLSFYSARHTYATALDAKDVPMSVIRDLLGHNDERTTREYVKRKGQRVLDAADELLR